MKKLFALAVIAAFCTPAFAQDKKPNPDETFKKLDKNGDSKVSFEEFKGKREGDKAAAAEKQFKAKDKDSDGFLTLEEFKAPVKKAK